LGGEASGLVDGQPVVVVDVGLGSGREGVSTTFGALGDRSVAGKILFELDPPG
jgi:hypothetical protein